MPTYTIKIDDETILQDVDLDELFTYVTPRTLEAFEHQTFRRDSERRRLVYHARREARDRQRRPVNEVSRDSSSQNGSAISRDETIKDEHPDSANESTRRPRPSYSHLYRIDQRSSRARLLDHCNVPNKTVSGAGHASDKSKRTSHTSSSPDRLLEHYKDSLRATRNSSPAAPPSAIDTDLAPSKPRLTGAGMLTIPDAAPLTDAEADPPTSTSSPTRPFAFDEAKSSNMQETGIRPDTVPDSETSTSDYEIEKLIGHGRAQGNSKQMLYHVKWVGSDQATWEPEDNFNAVDIKKYWKDHDSKARQKNDRKTKASDDPIVEPEEPTKVEDEYEIEAILGHQLSEPSTHKTHAGKRPVMLYKVKWKGYDETTWEPKECFEDAVLTQYWAGQKRLAQRKTAPRKSN